VQAARQLLPSARAALAASPALPLLLAAGACFLVLACADGGYAPTDWYPAGLFLIGLLAAGLLTLPAAPRPPALVTGAVAALFGYAVWSYLSIAWAGERADAWDGANRTLVLAAAFSLFALWRVRARTAAYLIGGFAVAIAVVALVELLRAASAADPASFFIGDRFDSPINYPNANVALFMIAFWPCVILAAAREVPAALRSLLVAAAVVLTGASLMGQSRGWLFAMPVAVLAAMALSPRRVRLVLVLLLVAVAAAVFASPVLHVYDAGRAGRSDALRHAVRMIVIGAGAAAAIAGFAAVLDRRVRPSRSRDVRAGRALLAAAVAVVAIGLVVFTSLVGNPVTKAGDAWDDFKTQPTPKEGGSSRLGRSLGSNRYDFWRVSWERFGERPVAGIGADNFQQDYLVRRKSGETPRYPHSLPLRVLLTTGIVGGVLLGGALVAALAAALLAVRRRAGAGAAATAAAAAGGAYWLVHGAVDWFWEFPGLAAPALAMLGLAAGMVPRRPELGRMGRRPLARGPVGAAVVGLAGLAAAVSLALPWLSELNTRRAIEGWPSRPERAFERLDRAAGLNPLSARPELVAGTIALRLDRPREAERRFAAALDRDDRNAYAHLELGALLTQRTRTRARGRAELRRALELNPRDPVIGRIAREARGGRAVDIAGMNAEIQRRSRLVR
jgi:tetratricopeptide (TPR) repeat protein